MDMVEGFRREELKEKLKEAANNVSSTKKQLAEASASKAFPGPLFL
mgnify:CR=1 FL=1